jgi:(2S)-methylsuccinyl-CoA dehydrogenase
MPHDGQTAPVTTEQPVLDDLLALTSEAVRAAEALLGRALDIVRLRVTVDGKVAAPALDADQTAVHGLAWVATYVEALRQMQGWAERLEADGAFGETERLIHQIAFGEYLWQLYGGIPMSQGEIVRLQDLGLRRRTSAS